LIHLDIAQRPPGHGGRYLSFVIFASSVKVYGGTIRARWRRALGWMSFFRKSSKAGPVSGAAKEDYNENARIRSHISSVPWQGRMDNPLAVRKLDNPWH
jgi:hypothetical protein